MTSRPLCQLWFRRGDGHGESVLIWRMTPALKIAALRQSGQLERGPLYYALSGTRRGGESSSSSSGKFQRGESCGELANRILRLQRQPKTTTRPCGRQDTQTSFATTTTTAVSPNYADCQRGSQQQQSTALHPQQWRQPGDSTGQ